MVTVKFCFSHPHRILPFSSPRISISYVPPKFFEKNSVMSLSRYCQRNFSIIHCHLTLPAPLNRPRRQISVPTLLYVQKGCFAIFYNTWLKSSGKEKAEEKKKVIISLFRSILFLILFEKQNDIENEKEIMIRNIYIIKMVVLEVFLIYYIKKTM